METYTIRLLDVPYIHIMGNTGRFYKLDLNRMWSSLRFKKFRHGYARYGNGHHDKENGW